MSTPITFPNLPQNAPYCTIDDVKNLIGQVAQVVNGTATIAQFQSAIKAAQASIDNDTKSFFSPRRIVERLAGAINNTVATGHPNLIAVNSVQAFLSSFPSYYYANLNAPISYDWDILFDGAARAAGIVTFSPYRPMGGNIVIDAWYGPTETVYGETLTTTDHATYAFANPTVVKQTAFSQGRIAPPKFYPIIYKNGIELTNTTFVLDDVNVWQTSTDNLFYTFNTGASGISGITFGSSLQSSDVITADYVYWQTPDDIRLACAKKAACTLLRSFGTATFAKQQFQGVDSIQIESSKLTYTGGQWGVTIAAWEADYAETCKSNYVPQLAWGLPTRGTTWGGRL